MEIGKSAFAGRACRRRSSRSFWMPGFVILMVYFCGSRMARADVYQLGNAGYVYGVATSPIATTSVVSDTHSPLVADTTGIYSATTGNESSSGAYFLNGSGFSISFAHQAESQINNFNAQRYSAQTQFIVEFIPTQNILYSMTGSYSASSGDGFVDLYSSIQDLTTNTSLYNFDSDGGALIYHVGQATAFDLSDPAGNGGVNPLESNLLLAGHLYYFHGGADIQSRDGSVVDNFQPATGSGYISLTLIPIQVPEPGTGIATMGSICLMMLARPHAARGRMR